MVVTAAHILAKLEGLGDKAKPLLKEFEEFRPWMDNILKPKELNESKKIHKLFRLLLRSYDLLGLSRL